MSDRIQRLDKLVQYEGQRPGCINVDKLAEAAAIEIERLREDCAQFYQAVGATTMKWNEWPDVQRLLDNISAAMDGRPREHEELLPWPRDARLQQLLYDGQSGGESARSTAFREAAEELHRYANNYPLHNNSRDAFRLLAERFDAKAKEDTQA